MSRLPVEGETFGRYRLLRRLGHGGMGVVYAALDTVLNREVALKLVAPHLADDEGFRSRFAREAEVLARIDSERAVRIFDHGEHEGVLFISTQLIEGGDLTSLMREAGALSPALAVEVVSQVLEGLGDAHAVGVTHRDVKPANVLVRQRAGEVEAYLCDFGIATAAGAQLTRTGSVAGSLPYMAPERHSGDDPGAAGDIYSAGCLFWFTLTGSAPYIGTDVEVGMAHLQARVPQLPGKDDFSKRANAVLARAMAKDRRKRYAGATAMRADLQALAAVAPGTLQLPGATSVRHSVVAPKSSRWRVPLVAVVSVLAAIGGSLAARALVAGEPEATKLSEVEVTTTIRGPQGRNIAEQRTLRPPLAVVTMLEPRPGQDGPGLETEGPRSAAPSHLATAPLTSTPRPPTPAAAYWCWNGTTGATLDDCGMPQRKTGLEWIFRGASPAGCVAEGTTGTQVAVVSCPYGAGAQVRLAQYTSVKAAYDQYNRGYEATGATWFHDGADWGWSWSKQVSATVYRSTRLHRAGPYIVSIQAPNRDTAAAGWSHVTFRDPAHFPGVPCSETARC